MGGKINTVVFVSYYESLTSGIFSRLENGGVINFEKNVPNVINK
jgi:hypothetical protein